MLANASAPARGPPARRTARALAAAGLAVALAACNAAKLAYQNADWLIEREVDAYVELDDGQSRALRAALETRLAHHRGEELAAALALLRRLRGLAVDGVDRASAAALIADADRLVRRTIVDTVPVFAPVLADLAPEQIDQLEARMRERGSELREKYLPDDPREREEGRRERAVERVEDWIGSVDDAQRAAIHAALARVPYTAADWLGWRRAMQRRLLLRLRRGDTAAELEPFLVRWWGERAGRSERLLARGAALERMWIDLIVELGAGLSERQREHLLARIDDYLEAFGPLVATTVECARRGESPPPASC